MEAANSIALEQEKIGKAIIQLLSNCKKDSQSRKNENYFTAKLETLEDYWYAARKNHDKMIALDQTEHSYVVSKFFDQLGEKYQEAKKYLSKGHY